MKCYAVGTWIEKNDIAVIDYYFPGRFYSTFFIKQAIQNSKQKIAAMVQELTPFTSSRAIVNGYHIACIKLKTNVCVSMTDISLNDSQLRHLARNLLTQHIEKKTIANNIELYTQDPKMAEARAISDSIEKQLLHNIDLAIGNEQELKQLIHSAEELKDSSFQFRRKTGCWPGCPIM